MALFTYSSFLLIAASSWAWALEPWQGNEQQTHKTVKPGCGGVLLLLPQQQGASAPLLNTAQGEGLACHCAQWSQAGNLWEEQLQLLVFARIDQSSINTHIQMLRLWGKLCHFSWAWVIWVMAFPAVPWSKALESSTWLFPFQPCVFSENFS